MKTIQRLIALLLVWKTLVKYITFKIVFKD